MAIQAEVRSSPILRTADDPYAVEHASHQLLDTVLCVIHPLQHRHTRLGLQGELVGRDATVPQYADRPLAHAHAAVAGSLQKYIEVCERRGLVCAHVLAEQVYGGLTHGYGLVLRQVCHAIC